MSGRNLARIDAEVLGVSAKASISIPEEAVTAGKGIMEGLKKAVHSGASKLASATGEPVQEQVVRKATQVASVKAPPREEKVASAEEEHTHEHE